MLGMRHFYHVSPSGSTPHRSSLGYAHPPPSPWSHGDFTKPENEKSYTMDIPILYWRGGRAFPLVSRYANASSSAFASWRSAVSKPSVNQP